MSEGPFGDGEASWALLYNGQPRKCIGRSCTHTLYVQITLNNETTKHASLLNITTNLRISSFQAPWPIGRGSA